MRSLITALRPSKLTWLFFGALVFISAPSAQADTISVMAYNVENFFDTIDDPTKRDEEFLPDGRYRWTEEKLHKKSVHLAEVVLSIENSDGTRCPHVLGLAEVENHYVLKRWKDHYLEACEYKTIIIDKKGSDFRGIKNAVMTKLPFYEDFRPKSHLVYRGARLILEVPLAYDGHPLIVFMNHWKSRSSRESDNGREKRFRSARVLKKRMDEIHKNNPFVDLLVLGDLNDEPEDDPVRQGLGLKPTIEDLFDDLEGSPLWNPSVELTDQVSPWEDDRELRKKRATYYWRHGDTWNQLDHILLSRGLFDDQGFRYIPGTFRIVRHPQFTDRQGAPLPYRPGYWDGRDQDIGGASDHFPVLSYLFVE